MAARRHTSSFLRALALCGAGLLLGTSIYAGLIHAGLVPSPFDPSGRGDLALARGSRPGLRVLFVGNSFTFKHDMPAIVHRLAAADHSARPIFAAEYTAPGWRLKEAADDEGLAALLEDVNWDVVALQEQSRIPSLPLEQRRREMHPFAHSLNAKIRASNAHTVLFMTWGYEHGDDAHRSHDTFEAMQTRLAKAYSELAAELSAPTVPVGLAWAEARRRIFGLDLWESDGGHPNLRGSYLTACVFYAFLSGRNPVGNRFTAGLPRQEAEQLQRAAATVIRSYNVPFPPKTRK